MPKTFVSVVSSVLAIRRRSQEWRVKAVPLPEDLLWRCETLRLLVEQSAHTPRRSAAEILKHVKGCRYCLELADDLFAVDGNLAVPTPRCWLVMESFASGLEPGVDLELHALRCESCEESVANLAKLTGGSQCEELWRLLLAPARGVRRMCLDEEGAGLVSFRRTVFARTALHSLLTMGIGAADRPAVEAHLGTCAECVGTQAWYEQGEGSLLGVGLLGPPGPDAAKPFQDDERER